MAENNVLDIEEDVQDEQKTEKRGGFLPLFFTILRYIAYLLVLSVFVVIISVLTVRTLQKQSSLTNTAGPIAINTQRTIPEDLDWFTTLGEIRGSTKDKKRRTFIVDAHIGYIPQDQMVLQEITRRRVQIRERISLYFSEHYAEDLEGAQNFIRIKNELREIINRIMNNKIREVAFNSFQVIIF